MVTNSLRNIVFCLGLPTIVILIVAVIGTKHRLEFAKQISQQVKSGHYSQVATKEMHRKIRLLTAFGMIDLLFLGLLVILFAFHPILFSSPVVRVAICIDVIGLSLRFQFV